MFPNGELSDSQPSYIELFTHLSHIVTQTTDLSAVCAEAVEVIMKVQSVENCSIMLIAPGTDHLCLAASSHIPKELWDDIEIRLGDGVAGKVALAGQPRLVARVSKSDKSSKAPGDRYKTNSYISLPMKNMQGATIGVINATDHVERRALTSDDLDMLEAIAQLVACAVENHRLWVRTHESRVHLSQVLEGLPIGMFTISDTGLLTLCNASARRFLQLEEATELDAPWEGSFPEAVRPHVARAIKDLVAGRDWYVDEFNLPPTNGGNGERSVRLSAVVAEEIASQEASHVLFLIEDLQQMQELFDLRRSDQMKSNFLSLISHELRTPLAAVKGAIHLIDQMVSAEMREKAGRVLLVLHRNCDRLTKLVNNILDVLDLDSDTLRLYRKKTDLSELVSQVVRKYQSGETEKNIEWVLDMDEGSHVEIYLDENRIGQVFEHLIENAVKFTPNDGVIEVHTGRENGMWRLSVLNSGRGIDTSQQEKIFSKFYQVDTSLTRDCGGSGLGLYLCRKFARLHGGEVDVQCDAPGKVCFSVTLPEVTELG